MLERLAGNAALKADLGRALAANRLSHSLLLVGEPGCGAGFAARCLAADYLYPQGGPHAEAVLRGEDTECLTLRGEGASGQIPVAKIRTAREAIQRSALSADARGRVLFLYGAQNLNGASANALLKILEEPPEGVLFLLTAVSAATVLATIRSRCALYTVAPVARAAAAAVLQNAAPAAPLPDLPSPAAPLPDLPSPAELAFLYEGHIGSGLRIQRDTGARARLADARRLCGFAERGETFLALGLLSGYEKEREGVPELLRQAACLASGALRQPGYAGLSAARAACVITAADEALRVFRANGNLKLLLTAFGGSITR